MSVKVEAMNLFRTPSIYQWAYACTRNELPLSGVLDSWR
jgi:hypothetical protein